MSTHVDNPLAIIDGVLEEDEYNRIREAEKKIEEALGSYAETPDRRTAIEKILGLDSNSLDYFELKGKTEIFAHEFSNIYRNQNFNKIIIPEYITKIGFRAFHFNTVNEIDLSKIRLKELGNECLSRCYNFDKIKFSFPQDIEILNTRLPPTPDLDFRGDSNAYIFPESLTAIKNGIIYATESNTCNLFKNYPIIFEKNLKEIGNYNFVFRSTIDLDIIIFKSKVPPTLGSNCFTNVNLKKICVPYESVDDYKSAANWSSLSQYIIGARI